MCLGYVQKFGKYIPKTTEKNCYGKLSEKANTYWIWTEKEQTKFDQLKKKMKKIEYLAIKKLKTILSIDATTIGIEATIYQVDDNEERRPNAYSSQKLNRAGNKYAINKLRMLAIVHEVERLKFYLLSRKFAVESNHKLLISVFSRHKISKTYSSRLTKWKERLNIYDFEIDCCKS